jgi:hypothetical protein
VGGQHKSHKPGSPSVLRIVLDVEFDPETTESAVIDEQVNRVRALAREKMDLSPYDELEIHLVQRVPEAKSRSRSYRFPLVD